MVKKNLYYRLFMRFRKLLPKIIRIKIVDMHYKLYGYKMPWSALRFEFHVVDKCNLNCAGCLHFSQLCNKTEYLDIHYFEKDIKRLSELTGGIVSDIRILGGEPLLHPEINKFLEITRKYFPSIPASDDYGRIELVTNGILLPNQTDQFWQVCSENNIIISISDYPIQIKKEFIKEKANIHGNRVKYTEEWNPIKMTGSANQWAKIPMDIEGRQNYKCSFGKCFLAGSCFQLVSGRIYKCARIAFIKHFNEKFNFQLETLEDDYIDIYKVNNVDEILNELTEPAKFCRYCKAEKITWNNIWKSSTKSIEEYT
jgi:sulfatase maturation enzyme AslB (radical SAM superfamily)